MTIRHFDSFDVYKTPADYKPDPTRPTSLTFIGIDIGEKPSKSVRAWYRFGKLVKVEEL